MSDWEDSHLTLNTITVHEQEQKPAIVYDHTGQPWSRPKPPMGFIDPANPPKASKQPK